MIGFFIKKAFFDGWDNLISMVVHNLGYLVLLFAFFGVLSLVPSNLPFFLVIILGTGLLSFYTAGASSASWAYALPAPGWSDFKRGFDFLAPRSALLDTVPAYHGAGVPGDTFYLSFETPWEAS